MVQSDAVDHIRVLPEDGFSLFGTDFLTHFHAPYVICNMIFPIIKTIGKGALGALVEKFLSYHSMM